VLFSLVSRTLRITMPVYLIATERWRAPLTEICSVVFYPVGIVPMVCSTFLGLIGLGSLMQNFLACGGVQ